MAQLVAVIVSQDDAFKKHFGRLLRAGPSRSASSTERAGREATTPDVVIVDARGDASSAMSNIERLRASAAGAGLFAIASVADPDLILQSMRAGANEFFAWPPDEETFHGAGPPHRGAARNRRKAPGRRRLRSSSSAPKAAPAPRRSRSTAASKWRGSASARPSSSI
jgi:FixJ family two-component response regulator